MNAHANVQTYTQLMIASNATCRLTNTISTRHLRCTPQTCGSAPTSDAGRNPPLATKNLLENTDDQCSLAGGTLLPSIYADARYIDAVIVSKAASSSVKVSTQGAAKKDNTIGAVLKMECDGGFNVVAKPGNVLNANLGYSNITCITI